MANYLPVTYQQGWNYGNGANAYPTYPAQQSGFVQNPVQTGYGAAVPPRGIKWVDGEAEAKGTPIPSGETQYAMWDINEPVIYIKSLNQMGMPNPMQKAHYQIEGMHEKSGTMGNGSSMHGGTATSGDAEKQEQTDMTKYVRHEELERMRKELMEAIGGINSSDGYIADTGTVNGTSAMRRASRSDNT